MSSSTGGDAPSDANDGCVGPTSSDAGKASACAGCPNQTACSSGAFSSPAALAAREGERAVLRNSLSDVSHVVLVLSGKGGVGKSTVSTQVAQALSSRGYDVGLLDVDICGPSIPRMAGVVGRTVHQSQRGWEPVYANPNLAVMSISFLLEEGDAAVVWRGPRKNGLIKQFLTETYWGEGGLDYLIVDTPPGTSDEHISIVQYLNDARPTDGGGRSSGASGAIVVTTPEEVSMADVRKELNFCKKTGVPVLGIVENMSGLQIRVSDLSFSRGESSTSDGGGGERWRNNDGWSIRRLHERRAFSAPGEMSGGAIHDRDGGRVPPVRERTEGYGREIRRPVPRKAAAGPELVESLRGRGVLRGKIPLQSCRVPPERDRGWVDPGIARGR